MQNMETKLQLLSIIINDSNVPLAFQKRGICVLRDLNLVPVSLNILSLRFS